MSESAEKIPMTPEFGKPSRAHTFETGENRFESSSLEDQIASTEAHDVQERLGGGMGALSPEMAEIFGSTDAFSERWTRLHGLPDITPANPLRGIPRDFHTAEAFSDLAVQGLAEGDTAPYYKFNTATETSEDNNFRRASQGFLRLIVLDHAMRSSRIDSVARTLEGQYGITPQGVAQWLAVDQETRRCLALFMRLQGYEVADRNDPHDEIPGLIETDGIGETTNAEGKKAPRKAYALPGLTSIRPVYDSKGNRVKNPDGSTKGVITPLAFEDPAMTPEKMGQYLEAVRQAVQVENGSGTLVPTDLGVVRLAYTIFRYFGHHHQNEKFEDLIFKYRYTPDNWYLKEKYQDETGDLEYIEVAPFIERIGDPRYDPDPSSGGEPGYDAPMLSLPEKRPLPQVLATEGVMGLAQALNHLPAERARREWSDMNLMLDAMDNLYDNRRGIGGAADLRPEERRANITKAQKELKVLWAKRRHSDISFKRIISHDRVSMAVEASRESIWESIKRQQREVLGFFGIRPPKPGIKGDRGKTPVDGVRSWLIKIASKVGVKSTRR